MYALHIMAQESSPQEFKVFHPLMLVIDYYILDLEDEN